MFTHDSHPTFARPARLLLLAALGCLIVVLLSVWLTHQQPWLGIQFSVQQDHVVVTATEPHLAAHIPHGAITEGLRSPAGAAIKLHPEDLIEEPDLFDTYAQMNDFITRQSLISIMLSNDIVVLQYQSQDGVQTELNLKPLPRPVTSLPFVFWYQLFCGFAALLIALWVFALRPNDWGTRMFLATGFFLALATTTAAIYSTRELALPGELIRTLSALNHLGAQLFGCALIALFLVYPRRLVQLRTLLIIPLVFVPWWITDVLQMAPNMDWGTRIPVMLEMLLAVVFGVAQWRKSRRDPLDRASLRWFALSALVGCSMFVLTIVVPSALNIGAPVSQGYAFGFFLIMYIGIALGLGRYRLFDLDIWAYRVLLWVGGAALVLGMDITLILLGLGEATSLGITLLLCGWLYFPFRQWLWLWLHITKIHVPDIEGLLPELSAIAFTVSPQEQQARWEALLQRIFEPLQLEQGAEINNGSGLREGGLVLHVSTCGKLPSYSLRYAGSGARLFSTRDATYIITLCHLLEQVMSGRTSYEQGVAQERLRIGRDLHDNIGARLLKLIHHLRGTPDADIARDAMKDLRTAIAAMDSQPVPLLNALGDWRAEANSRCEAAGCQLIWQQPEVLPEVQLLPRAKAMLESVMREIVTNALKHATPSNIKIEINANSARLRATVSNDGDIADPHSWKDGYGLRNIRSRLEELGGKLNIAGAHNEVKLTIDAALS